MLWLSSADALLIAAQTLFCLLPLISLLVRRAGVPAPVHTTQLLAMSASLLAFALLVAMFILLEKPVSLYLQDQWRGALFTAAAHFPTTFAQVGIAMCSLNLTLRVVEAIRIAQLAVAANPRLVG